MGQRLEADKSFFSHNGSPVTRFDIFPQRVPQPFLHETLTSLIADSTPAMGIYLNDAYQTRYINTVEIDQIRLLPERERLEAIQRLTNLVKDARFLELHNEDAIHELSVHGLDPFAPKAQALAIADKHIQEETIITVAHKWFPWIPFRRIIDLGAEVHTFMKRDHLREGLAHILTGRWKKITFRKKTSPPILLDHESNIDV